MLFTKTLPLTLALTVSLSTVSAHAAEPTEPVEGQKHAPGVEAQTRFGLSAQVFEIAALNRGMNHQALLLGVGAGLAHPVARRWTLTAGIGFATGLDNTSLGVSAAFGAEYELVRRGPFHVGIGPDLSLVQNWFRKGPKDWGTATVLSPGVGFSAGYRGTMLLFGLAPGYSPQGGGTWALTARAGISTSF